uniref:Uncharacterized protein n=1 Tax=Octopus bimaculoides TaxID=37653 RepID=A0A0L8FRY4_OCTBM
MNEQTTKSKKKKSGGLQQFEHLLNTLCTKCRLLRFSLTSPDSTCSRKNQSLSSVVDKL